MKTFDLTEFTNENKLWDARELINEVDCSDNIDLEIKLKAAFELLTEALLSIKRQETIEEIKNNLEEYRHTP